ncbi:MAG: hypothetical protein JWL89_444 [Candidatus Saccharibacteria bacterium]|jgi:hypothetical protein|nr:hypothetical protein [Candidatus Saccharibacteria bacterium]
MSDKTEKLVLPETVSPEARMVLLHFVGYFNRDLGLLKDDSEKVAGLRARNFDLLQEEDEAAKREAVGFAEGRVDQHRADATGLRAAIEMITHELGGSIEKKESDLSAQDSSPPPIDIS